MYVYHLKGANMISPSSASTFMKDSEPACGPVKCLFGGTLRSTQMYTLTSRPGFMFTLIRKLVMLNSLHSSAAFLSLFPCFRKRAAANLWNQKPCCVQDVILYLRQVGLHSSQTRRGVDFYSFIPGTVHHLVGDVQVEV